MLDAVAGVVVACVVVVMAACRCSGIALLVGRVLGRDFVLANTC